MTQNKRGLRDRNKKKPFGDDNEQEQINGYSKPYAKQIYNPSLQLNLDAKLLIKFLNVINKKYNQYNQETQKQHTKSCQLQQNNRIKDINNASKNRTNPRCINYAKIYNSQPAKKNVVKTNGNSQLTLTNKSIKNDQYLNKIKALSQESASSVLQLQKSLNKNQINHNNIHKNSISNLKNKEEAKNYSISKQRYQQGYDVKKFNATKLGTNSGLKKSVIHVWIAHYIYKNVIKSDNDPTLAAKKLKQQVLKSKYPK